MGGTQLFAASVALYALLPMLILATGSFRYILLYTHIASILVLGGFLGTVYSVPVTDTIEVGAGQLLYAP